jgi:two-component system nitrate/nitrite sensor histidine kinase NarX
MNLGRIRRNFGIAFIALLLLVALSVGVTLFIVQGLDRAELSGEAARTVLVQLRILQAVFLAAAVVLLVGAYLWMQRTLLGRISELVSAVEGVTGEDLAHDKLAAGDELRDLAGSFQRVCQDLTSSKLELECWAAELEERVAQRTQQLAALFEISTEIASNLEIESVLQSIVEKTRDLVRGEIAVLCLLDPQGRSLTVAAVDGLNEACSTEPQTVFDNIGEPCAEEALLHEGCECKLLEPRFRRSHLVVPLHGAGRVLGMLCVGHREASRFGEEEVQLLNLLANTGAIALENARLYEQVAQEAALDERERIVARIHDGLAQILAFLGLRLSAVKESIEQEELTDVPENLALIQRAVEQADREVRQMMAGLQTTEFRLQTFEDLLSKTADRFAHEHGMSISLNLNNGSSIPGSQDSYEQVVRIVHEALTNVHKHARDSHVTITLERHDGEAAVHIQDDGPGLAVDRLALDGQHFGLKVMRTRAEWLGGDLQIESEPGQGTRVTLRWPVVGGEDGGEDG